jgi:hypothetical protein
VGYRTLINEVLARPISRCCVSVPEESRNPCWTTVAGCERALRVAGAESKISDILKRPTSSFLNTSERSPKRRATDTVQPLPSIDPFSTTASRCRMNAEQTRLRAAGARRVAWKTWGPSLSDRQWGTVREDYSRNGD